MKRLIYAEDAMRRIKAETRFYSGTYAEIERAIDTAPTVDPESLRPAGRLDKRCWISVKDRLPEVFDEVLVYFNGFISIAWRETEKRKNGIVGWHWDSQMSYPESFVNVTHWMPLPNPPKTETERK